MSIQTLIIRDLWQFIEAAFVVFFVELFWRSKIIFLYEEQKQRNSLLLHLLDVWMENHLVCGPEGDYRIILRDLHKKTAYC